MNSDRKQQISIADVQKRLTAAHLDFILSFSNLLYSRLS